MGHPQLRPRFHLKLPCPPEVVIARLRERIEASDQVCIWSLIHHHVVLCIPEKDRHYWSPILDLHIDKIPEGSHIWGHFGPHPNVWTLFTALYVSIGFTGFLSLMFALSQMMAGELPLGLLGPPLALLAMGLLWLVGLAGQKMAQAQMLQLKQFFDQTLCDL